jgi:hypothetical protein
MNIQALVKPLFRLIILTRTSLFITNPITEVGMKKIVLFLYNHTLIYKKKELTYNSSGNQKLYHYFFFCIRKSV